MAQSVRKPTLRRGGRAQEEERRELMNSLTHTRTLINQAYGGFNTASDSDLIESYMAWCLAGLLLCAALLLLRRPVARLLQLALRSSVGLAVLALFSQVGGFVGIKLGVNLVNALILGALGAPGFGLLLMLQWVLR